jgi:hypothetical protein
LRWDLQGTSFHNNEACCSNDEGRAIVHLGMKAGMAASVTTTQTTLSCGQNKSNMVGLLSFSLCVPLLDVIVRQLSAHLDWYHFHYPKYWHFVIYYQSLLVLLSFLWTLKYDVIHSVRDLKRIGSWSQVGSTKRLDFL